jgi:hypothetical protein
VSAADRCAAQTRKEAASPPLTVDQRAAAPGLGDTTPREGTAVPPASRLLRIACDDGPSGGGLERRRPLGPSDGNTGNPEPARPRRGASDAPVPGAAGERQGRDELAFDRQKEPQKHTKPLTRLSRPRLRVL